MASHKPVEVPPLSDSLGLPDVFPFEPSCPENLLSPESLANGYRISYEEFGFTDKRELELTLCNEQEQWSASGVAACRKAVLQQLRLVYRSHKAKRKADVLYDQPVGASNVSTAILYPTQHAVGEAARQQWSQDLAGSVHLDVLASSVPHGFMRGKLFDMLSDQRVALPRAVWFIQVAYLNRTKPEGWEGGSKLPTRSLQCTEELLAYMEQAAAAVASSTGSEPSTGSSTAYADAESGARGRWQYLLHLTGRLHSSGLLHTASLVGWLLGKAAGLPLSLQLQLLPLLHLTMPDVALSPQLLRQVLDACLKHTALPTEPAPASRGANQPAGASVQHQSEQQQQQQQQQLLRRGYAEVAATLLSLAPMTFVLLDQPSLTSLGALLRGTSSSGSPGEQHGEDGWCTATGAALGVLREVEKAQQRLAATVSPRVLRLADAKAMQLLDGHLASCDAAAAHTELWRLLLPPAPSEHDRQQAQRDLVRLVCSWAVARPVAHMAVALGARCQQQSSASEAGAPQEDARRWAMHSGLQAGRTLLALAILKQQAQQDGVQQAAQAQQPAAPGPGPAGAAPQLASKQQAKEASSVGEGAAVSAGRPLVRDGSVGGPAAAGSPAQQQQTSPAMQQALFGWLDSVAADCCAAAEGAEGPVLGQAFGSTPSPGASLVLWLHLRRVQQWAVLLVDNGLLSPSHYLRCLLASGMLAAKQQQQQGQGQGQGQGGGCPRPTFHLALLQELHPSLLAKAPIAAPPKSRHSSTPAPGTQLSGVKRRLSEGAEGTSEAGSGAAAAPAREGEQQQQQQQQQEEEQQAAAAYAAMRRAVLGVYGPQGAAAAPGLLGSRSWGAMVPQGGQPRSQMSPAPVSESLQSLSMDTSVAPSGLDDWWGGGGWEAPARAGTPATPTATGGQQEEEQEQEEAMWGGNAAPHQLRRRLAHLLGLQGRDAAGPGAAAAAAAPQPPDVQQQLWRDALDDICTSTAWQRRHLASWLHTAARQHLRASLPAATSASASTPAAAGPTLSPSWLLSVLCTLDACDGHREVADLLCDLLAALLRTVASAVAVPGAAEPLGQRVWAAHDRFWRHTGLPPPLILRLVAAHHQQLAVLGRVPRLLRMLTAGLWTLVPTQAQQQQQGAARPHDPRQRQQAAPAQQQAQAQQEVLSCCHAQLVVAGVLLARYAGAVAQPGSRAASASIAKDGRAGAGGRGPGSHAAASPAPNSGVQQWVADMERQHGAQHWLLDALRRLASEAAAPRPGEAAGGVPGSGTAVAAASRGGSVAAGSARPGVPSAPATLAVAEWMAAAAGQQPGQQQAGAGGGGGSAAAAGLLQEALQLVRRATNSAGGSDSGLQAWQAAEQLAGWVCASAPTSPASASSDRGLQERAAAALLAIFQTQQAAASQSPQSDPTAAAGLGQQEAAGHPGLLDCLLRAVELLRRRCGQRLPRSFLPAAIVSAAQQQGAGKSCAGVPLLLLGAICQGLVTLEESLHCAPLSLAAALAVDLSTTPGMGVGECWAFSSLQRDLPVQAAAEALLAALPPAAAGSGLGGLAPQPLPDVPVSLAIQEACLSNARQLYAFLSKWATVQYTAGAPQQQLAQLPPYPPRMAALCCLMGRRQATGSRAESDLLSVVLAHAEPAAAPLCWLVVRAMLDEEVFCAALRRGESVRSALAAVSQQAAAGDSHATASTEAEKDFTSRVLSELAVRPSVSLTLCAVCGEAGQAVGDYLLQQLDWVLQDNDTLLGRQQLSAVLARRGALVTTAAFNTPPSHSASHAATPPEPHHRADTAAPGVSGSSSGSSGACSSGFAVEQGFVEAALVCLAASNDARRRSFAHQLVLQLQRLADAVERLALPSTSRPASAGQLGAQGSDQGSGAGAGAGQALTQMQAQAQAQHPPSEPSSQHLPGSPGQPYQAASPAAASPAGAGRAAAGRGPVGFGWRAGAAGGGWGSGARGAQRGKPGSEEVGSVSGVQAGVWLRLGILFPLLPLVYSDPSPDPTTSLRSLLLNAVTRLLGSPYITATPTDWSQSDVHSAAATAAAATAGEVLPARLLHVLHALVGSSWASWLQGGRQLRDVAAFDAVRHLGPFIDGLPAPKRLRLAAGAAVPTAHPALAAIPAAVVQGPVTPAAGSGPAEPHLLREARPPKRAACADPWLLLPGSATGSDAGQQYKQGGGTAGAAQLAPHWLLGAVRVRKRDGSYCSLTDP